MRECANVYIKENLEIQEIITEMTRIQNCVNNIHKYNFELWWLYITDDLRKEERVVQVKILKGGIIKH